MPPACETTALTRNSHRRAAHIFPVPGGNLPVKAGISWYKRKVGVTTKHALTFRTDS